MRRRALRAALRVGECSLALAGAICLFAYGFACARASLTQHRESAAFDEALRLQMQQRMRQIHEESPDRSEWSPARVARYDATRSASVSALGRLEIPEVELSVMVLEGTAESTLDRAVGRIEGTARPGEGGNLGIAGHRDGYFRGLRHLETADVVTLTTLDGVARYEIDRIEIVHPARVDVLAATDEPTLTLVTCYPFFHVGDAPWRYIVRARQVDYEAWSPIEADPDLASR